MFAQKIIINPLSQSANFNQETEIFINCKYAVCSRYALKNMIWFGGIFIQVWGPKTYPARKLH